VSSTDFPIRFDANGLVPAVTQDADTAAVLMVGFMNADALRHTRATGRVHYWSRSRARLWKKGETSGHEQIVDSISVNCEQNSLLIQVRQIGAVCHDGYPTCYYRRLEDDDSLTITKDRWFDPAAVYSSGTAPGLTLESLTRLWFSAFEYLRDTDLVDLSSTSRRLRSGDAGSAARIGQELLELAGVLDGSHRHEDLTSDVLLEGSQVLYWTAVTAVHAGIAWDQLRPDRGLATVETSMSPESVAKVLRGEATTWSKPNTTIPLDARLHAVTALVAQAAAAAGVEPAALISHDLQDLRAKPYLAGFFAPPTRM
jgi:phosphoribosyl-AMP cyclohydrolase